MFMPTRRQPRTRQPGARRTGSPRSGSTRNGRRPELHLPDLRKLATDAVYVTVGLGVLGFQRAQVRRRELQQQVGAQLGGAGEQLQKLTHLVDGARHAALEAQEQLVHLVGRNPAA
jgi:hypothetical protein